MKHLIDKLSGPLLDYAVAMAERVPVRLEKYRVYGGLGVTIIRSNPCCVRTDGQLVPYEPSVNRDLGWEIIERQSIATFKTGNGWYAAYPGNEIGYLGKDNYIDVSVFFPHLAPTPLIAGLRAYLRSRFDVVVDIPYTDKLEPEETVVKAGEGKQTENAQQDSVAEVVYEPHTNPQFQWKGLGPPPKYWWVGNTKVYRSYADYCG